MGESADNTYLNTSVNRSTYGTLTVSLQLLTGQPLVCSRIVFTPLTPTIFLLYSKLFYNIYTIRIQAAKKFVE